MLHIKLMRITHRQHASNDSVLTHTYLPLESESSHVAYEIKGNEAYDNTQANNLPLHTP